MKNAVDSLFARASEDLDKLRAVVTDASLTPKKRLKLYLDRRNRFEESLLSLDRVLVESESLVPILPDVTYDAVDEGSSQDGRSVTLLLVLPMAPGANVREISANVEHALDVARLEWDAIRVAYPV